MPGKLRFYAPVTQPIDRSILKKFFNKTVTVRNDVNLFEKYKAKYNNFTDLFNELQKKDIDKYKNILYFTEGPEVHIIDRYIKYNNIFYIKLCGKKRAPKLTFKNRGKKVRKIITSYQEFIDFVNEFKISQDMIKRFNVLERVKNFFLKYEKGLIITGGHS